MLFRSEQFYSTLASLAGIGNEKGASMLFLKHGIPGLRYLDQGSRRAGKGTHNFVVWDEDAMSIEETYYQRQTDPAENIRRGQAAMEKVISEQTDVMDAMHRDDLGSISFLWGEPGRGDKFKGGSGISHIIAHRNAQGYDGEAVARKMVEVIAKGKLDKVDSVDKGSRAYLKHDGHTAVMSLYRDGERQTWLLTGWEDYKEKSPDVSSEGDGSTGTTLHGPMRARPEEGAGASNGKSRLVDRKSVV